MKRRRCIIRIIYQRRRISEPRAEDIKSCDKVLLMLTRRSFVKSSLASGAIAPLTLRGAYKKVPVGLEMYSVRGELMKDLPGTVNAVAKMGYEVMEFYAPYF